MTRADEWRERIAANIRAERARARIPQREVTDAMNELGFGWYRQTLSQIETLGRAVHAEEVIALAQVLQVPIAALTGDHP